MKKTFATVLVSFISCLAAPAHAFEYFPEFGSLTETEQDSLEGPFRLTSEYQSDVLTYTKPFGWEYDWISHPSAFDFAVGSIGASHFITTNRLKVSKMLTDSLEFRFTYFEEQDFERKAEHHMIELLIWATDKIAISLYGEPEHFKRNDDTGVALVFRPQPRHEIRLFNTFVDVTRLKRNDRSDTYIEPDLPYSRGLVGRIWSSPETNAGNFLQYAIRYDTPTRWLFPDEEKEYRYWQVLGSLFGRQFVSEKLAMSLRTQFDRKHESQAPSTSTSTEVSTAWLTDRWTTILRSELLDLGPGWELTTGIQYSSRLWRINDFRFWHRDVIPHLIWKIPAFGAGDRRDWAILGYDFSWHRGHVDPQFRDFGDVDGSINHRINLEYEFSFGKDAALVLQATGDLDKIFTRDAWEGGGGQFRMSF